MFANDTQNYDYLLHIVKECNYTDNELFIQVKQLFPEFDHTNPPIYNDHISESLLQEYSYYRSLGLSVREAANVIGLSGYLFERMLEGAGLSLDLFVKLVEAELYALSYFKVKHLRTLDSIAEKQKSLQATVTILEKVLPEQYSTKADLQELSRLLNQKHLKEEDLTIDQIEKQLKEKGLELPDFGQTVTGEENFEQ